VKLLVIAFGVVCLLLPWAGSSGANDPDVKIKEKSTVEKRAHNLYVARSHGSLTYVGRGTIKGMSVSYHCTKESLRCDECRKGKKWEIIQGRGEVFGTVEPGAEYQFDFAYATLEADLPEGKLPRPPCRLIVTTTVGPRR
jgi:hypothetical protein